MKARAEPRDDGRLRRRIDDLGQPAGDEHEHQVGADRGRGGASQQGVDDPADRLRVLGSDPFPAGRGQPPRRVQRHRGHRRPRAGRGAEDPIGRVAGQEDRRQRQDEHQSGDDEAQPAEDGADRPAQPPRAVDGQLRRCRAGEEVRGGDGVFELLGLDPLSLLDAHAAEQGDVGRGTPEPDATETEPLLPDGAEGHRRRGSVLDLTFVTAHGVSSPSTSLASSLSWRLVDSRVLRPLAVAT